MVIGTETNKKIIQIKNPNLIGVFYFTLINYNIL